MGFKNRKLKELKARRVLNMTEVPVSIYDDFGKVVTFSPVHSPSLYLANESTVETGIIYIVDGKFISEARQIGRSTDNFVVARDFGLGRDDTFISRLYDLEDRPVKISFHELLLSAR